MPLAVLLAMLATGCHVGPKWETAGIAACSDIPRELCMTSLPTYRIAPPDILLIEAVNNIRPPTATLRAGDVVHVHLANPEPLQSADPNASPLEVQFQVDTEVRAKLINGEYRIQPTGAIDLGPVYGQVEVAGLSIQDAQSAVRKHLRSYAVAPDGTRTGLKNPQVSVTWPDIAGKQAISGEHMVRQDGHVQLGIYGSVHVAGLTLDDARAMIEAHLSQHIHQPEVSVDVLGFNSTSYYVIMDGGGYGEQVRKLPITGNETVLDAIAAVDGLSQVSSKRIWVARPAPAGTGVAQVLPVNWHDISVQGITDTNYQLFPGDRIYVQADRLIEADSFVAKVIAPVERIFGFTLLGAGTIRSVRTVHQSNSSGSGGF